VKDLGKVKTIKWKMVSTKPTASLQKWLSVQGLCTQNAQIAMIYMLCDLGEIAIPLCVSIATHGNGRDSVG
jgi:hypothetical protein